jgi:SAM-dependent methyltransferase
VNGHIKRRRLIIKVNASLLTKIRNVGRGLIQSWGTGRMKRELWNREFASGRWDFIETSSGDIIYKFLEKYAQNGSILDLGCGSGNTSCELSESVYCGYLGVDVSDIALSKARQRSLTCGRHRKNIFVRADIATYVPEDQYELILFRESIYYIPPHRIRPTLQRYSTYLKPSGVIIVRSHAKKVAEELIALIGNAFSVVDEFYAEPQSPAVVVFRPQSGDTS